MDRFNFEKDKGFYYALLSTCLFGISIPISKYLLQVIQPWILAGLLYLGSAFGLSLIYIFRQFFSKNKAILFLKLSSCKWAAISALLGGIIGPVLLLGGLSKTSASTASLLLSFENVSTILLAWLVFKERIDSRTGFEMFLIVLGSIILAWDNKFNYNNFLGLVLIILACLSWALENNIVKKIANEDPIILALIKSSVAGITNTTLGLFAGETFPTHFSFIVVAILVGIIGYALSMICFNLALRYIGAARTGAFCSFTPLVGASFSILLLEDTWSVQLIIAAFLMTAGLFLHFSKIFIHAKILP